MIEPVKPETIPAIRGMGDLAHLAMSLSYTPKDDRIPETLRQCAAEIERLRALCDTYEGLPHRVAAENTRLREALEQAQACILGDDCDDPSEARSDTLQKIREALNVR